jgi:hypothetical protein
MSLCEYNPLIHEFGHLIGLKDRYRNDRTFLGWEGNIMANVPGVV